METTVKELGDSRVRVEVGVDPDQVESRIKEAATRLGKEMKVQGFREGKVPPEMVLQKVGRDAVLSEALQLGLGDWYERAMIEAGISPVGDPKLDLDELPGEGEPLKFAIEVNVLPEANGMCSNSLPTEFRRGEGSCLLENAKIAGQKLQSRAVGRYGPTIRVIEIGNERREQAHGHAQQADGILSRASEGSGLRPRQDDGFAAFHAERAAEVTHLVTGRQPSDHEDIIVLN